MEPMAMAAAVGEEVGVAVGVMVTVMLLGWGWSTAGREATSRLSGGLTPMLGRPGATSGIRVVGTATSRAARWTANGAAGGSRLGADSIYARRWIIGSEVVQSSIFGAGRRSRPSGRAGIGVFEEDGSSRSRMTLLVSVARWVFRRREARTEASRVLPSLKTCSRESGREWKSRKEGEK